MARKTSGKQSHETNASSRDHTWHQRDPREIKISDLSRLGFDLYFGIIHLSTGNTGNTLTLLCFPLVLFYICQLIFSREPPICAAIGNPSHLCASFVPVSSLSIVLSLLSDALLPIWKLVTLHITQLQLWSISTPYLSNAPSVIDRDAYLDAAGLVYFLTIFYRSRLSFVAQNRLSWYNIFVLCFTVSRPP